MTSLNDTNNNDNKVYTTEHIPFCSPPAMIVL